MEQIIYINGEFLPADEAKVSVLDRGYLYGDGIFETLRAYNGKVFKIDEHLNRLFLSAKAILINIPLKKSEIKRVIYETLQRNKLKDAYIRLSVSRGPGEIGIDIKGVGHPTLVIIVKPAKVYPSQFYQKGVKVFTATTRRLLPETLSPKIKSLNFLSNILARMEAKRNDLFEALMLNENGFVTEGTISNVFMVTEEDILITPPSYNILEGITRKTVIELAKRLKIKFQEKNIARIDLYLSKEAFLTFTSAGILPICEVDRRKIGNIVPGKITSLLMAEYKRLVEKECYSS
jgi:branched-chain amino acid aminotransferase